MKFLKHYWWFIALLAISALFLVQRKCTRSANLSQFMITNVADIDGISIVKGVDSISVNKTDAGWVLDEKQVDTIAVKSLFNVLSYTVTNSPVPSSKNDSIADFVRRNGTLLKIYSKGRVKLDFYAYYLPEYQNNIFVNNLTNEAFFVDLIDYSGDISELFITEKSYWIGNRLFTIPISKVLRAEVDIPKNPEESYIIGIGNGSFELFAKATNENLSSPNIDRLSRFISRLGNLSVTKLPADKQNILRDELKLIQPMRIITLQSDSQTSQIALYPIKVDKINELGVKVEFDPNRFYVVYADNQIAEATYVNFSSVLWDIADLVIKN